MHHHLIHYISYRCLPPNLSTLLLPRRASRHISDRCFADINNPACASPPARFSITSRCAWPDARRPHSRNCCDALEDSEQQFQRRHSSRSCCANLQTRANNSPTTAPIALRCRITRGAGILTRHARNIGRSHFEALVAEARRSHWLRGRLARSAQGRSGGDQGWAAA